MFAADNNMRKLKLYIACSIDGKIARADGSIDWLPDPAGDDYGYDELYNSIDAIVMGYKTYEITEGFGEWHFKGKTSYVFSRNAEKKVNEHAQLINENPADFVSRLKQEEGKDIWLLGGGELVSVLYNAGLIDEMIIAFVPLVLGDGIPLFPCLKLQQNMRLVSHNTYENGLVMLNYLAIHS